MRKIMGFAGTAASLALSLGALSIATNTASASEAGTAAGVIRVCKDASMRNCVTTSNTISDAGKQVPGYQDSISSIGNGTSTAVCFFEHNNYQGRSIRIPGGASVVDLSSHGLNDALSSWRPAPPPGGPTC
ncbi:hypothetical protein [Streptomyces sp. NPDC047706]|uniref:hypothetical protein n=1 Tax=Streptomyces sp. NPDC047706 TaxID=3365486 RepID=UPI003710755F